MAFIRDSDMDNPRLSVVSPTVMERSPSSHPVSLRVLDTRPSADRPTTSSTESALFVIAVLTGSIIFILVIGISLIKFLRHRIRLSAVHRRVDSETPVQKIHHILSREPTPRNPATVYSRSPCLPHSRDDPAALHAVSPPIFSRYPPDSAAVPPAVGPVASDRLDQSLSVPSTTTFIPPSLSNTPDKAHLPVVNSQQVYSIMMKRRAQQQLSSSAPSLPPSDSRNLPSFTISIPTSSSSSSKQWTPPSSPSPPSSPTELGSMELRKQPSNPFLALDDPIDYFSYKQPTYFGQPAKSKSHLGSHFSPMVTPAAQESLTRPTSPVLSSAFLPTGHQATPDGPTPDEDPFRYIPYESNYIAPPLSSPILASRPKVSSPLVPSVVVDVKIYFENAEELVKIRLNQRMAFADVIRTAAKRVPTGWQSLHASDPQVEVNTIVGADHRCLKKLANDVDWKSWLQASISNQRRRLVLWAI